MWRAEQVHHLDPDQVLDLSTLVGLRSGRTWQNWRRFLEIQTRSRAESTPERLQVLLDITCCCWVLLVQFSCSNPRKVPGSGSDRGSSAGLVLLVPGPGISKRFWFCAQAAQVVLIALFELNTPEFTMLLGALPKTFQDGATKLLHSHLKNSSNTSSGVVSPSRTSRTRSRPSQAQLLLLFSRGLQATRWAGRRRATPPAGPVLSLPPPTAPTVACLPGRNRPDRGRFCHHQTCLLVLENLGCKAFWYRPTRGSGSTIVHPQMAAAMIAAVNSRRNHRL